MTNYRTLAPLVATLAIAWSPAIPAGPHGHDHSHAQDEPSELVHEKPNREDQFRRIVGKSIAPVRWPNLAEYQADAGTTVPVDVGFTLTRPAELVHVKVVAEEGLRLNEPAIEFTFENVPVGPLAIPAVDVSIDVGGRHYVNAIVTLHTEGLIRGTAVSIPVGTQGSKTTVPALNKALRTDATGRPVRVMQASQPR